MSKVVNFRDKTAGRRESATRRAPQHDVADASDPGPRSRNLQSQAKVDLRGAALLLDLAVQQARQLGKSIRNPALRQQFDDGLEVIEELLRLARDKTLKL